MVLKDIDRVIGKKLLASAYRYWTPGDAKQSCVLCFKQSST